MSTESWYLVTFIIHSFVDPFDQFDCERERATAGVKSMTASLWTYIEINRSSFLNPLFHPEQVLSLNCDSRLLKLWPYHYRWDVSLIVRSLRFLCLIISICLVYVHTTAS
jgi:hypothetical protein